MVLYRRGEASRLTNDRALLLFSSKNWIIPGKSESLSDDKLDETNCSSLNSNIVRVDYMSETFFFSKSTGTLLTLLVELLLGFLSKLFL